MQHYIKFIRHGDMIPTRASSYIDRKTRAWEWGMLLERVLYVDYEAVFHVSIDEPCESLIDIIYLDDLNLWIDFVCCTEVNHFLDVFCTSSNTTRQGTCT